MQDAAQAVRLYLAYFPERTIDNIGAGNGTTVTQLAEACRAVFGPVQSAPPLIEPTAASPSHGCARYYSGAERFGYRPAFDIWSGLRDMKAQQLVE